MAPANTNKSLRILLVGNPNVGKTTLFNGLTGTSEKIANYCGVTVQGIEAPFFDNFGRKHTLVDLPGSYSLSAYSTEELVLHSALLGLNSPKPDRVICVLNAAHLERGLYFATQVIELGLPICIALTMQDVANKSGIHIDAEQLASTLKVPVLTLSGNSRQKNQQLRQAITQDLFKVSSFSAITLPEYLQESVHTLCQKTALGPTAVFPLLMQEAHILTSYYPSFETFFESENKKLQRLYPSWRTQLVQQRYQSVEDLTTQCLKWHVSTQQFNWDRFLLHPILGPLLAFFVFTGILSSVFIISEYPTQWIEQINNALRLFFERQLPSGWVQRLICEGILGGVGTLVAFLPQFALVIGLMSLLENTGYLARATFLLDRWMKLFGLSGQAFASLISCCACTVPGILQSRCLTNKAERKTTILIAPWINCSARLPIYILLISVIFKNFSSFQKMGFLLLIYGLGTFSALVLAGLVRKFWLKKTISIHLVEMPALMKPNWRYAIKLTLGQMGLFLKKAGTYILLFSVFLWAGLNFSISNEKNSQKSVIRWTGEKLEPLLRPIGYDWRIAVGLIASLGSRENFISTLGVIHNSHENKANAPMLHERLRQVRNSSGDPLYSLPTCLSLITFFMFSMQCIGTFVFIKQETNSLKWALAQFLGMGLFAYSCAFLVYQLSSRMVAIG